MCNYDRKEVVQDQFGCHGNIMTPSTDSGLGCREGSSKHDESLEQVSDVIYMCIFTGFICRQVLHGSSLSQTYRTYQS